MNNNKCPQCGAKYRHGAKFCPKCGYDLTKVKRQGHFHPRWTWYLGTIIFLIIFGAAIWFIINPMVTYHQILSQTYTGKVYQNQYGNIISDDLATTYGMAAVGLCIGMLGLFW